MNRIVTRHWQKPIPTNQFDWEATFDGYDAGDPIGYGATEAEAIADLIETAEMHAEIAQSDIQAESGAGVGARRQAAE